MTAAEVRELEKEVRIQQESAKMSAHIEAEARAAETAQALRPEIDAQIREAVRKGCDFASLYFAAHGDGPYIANAVKKNAYCGWVHY